MKSSRACITGNISANVNTAPPPKAAEQVDVLVATKGVRVERIVSLGHRSPDGFWYDQAQDEFVLLVSGEALLVIEHQGECRLGAGDWVHIPAHVRHRVEWTDPSRPAVWLAVFASG